MKLLECARHLKDGWLQDECGCRHLRAQEFTQDKTRREEDTSLSHSLTKLVEVLYSQKSILLFQRLKPSFYRGRTGHQLQRSLQEKLSKVAYNSSTSSA